MQKKVCFSAFLVALVIFISTTNLVAQTEKIIHTFTGADGSNPYGGVIADAKGNLYGTTYGGGGGEAGEVYELVPVAGEKWNEVILHSFSFGTGDGELPMSNLVFDKTGNLYGITLAGGGMVFAGTGAVFELSPTVNGTWTENVIYSFTIDTDRSPVFGGGLTIDSTGNLYGLVNGGAHGLGAVFELTPGPNNTWAEKVLYSFSGHNDGQSPVPQQLAIDAKGNVYGEALGGEHDYGVVFKLIHTPSGAWSEHVIYAFAGGADESYSLGGMSLDQHGNLYGASQYSIFELSPSSNGIWAKRTLHTFTGGSDGAFPDSALTFDVAGNLYSMTNSGGAHRGTVFELMPSADGSWTEKILHKFSGTNDGINPFYNGVTVGPDGVIYGTTTSGGASNNGVVFAIKP